MSKSTTRKAEAMIDQLEGMVEEAGQLIKETTEESVKKQLNAFKDNMQDLSNKLKGYYDDVEEAVVSGAKTTDKVIRNHPYESLAISLAIGVLIGALIRSR
jgi:ElaB/YqjD/DUF883 family membrane-anchored ribosome-binding protein